MKTDWDWVMRTYVILAVAALVIVPSIIVAGMLGLLPGTRP